MTENQTIKDRIISLLEALEMSQGKFEKECRLSNGWVSSIKSAITTEKIQQIIKRFPDVNPSWIVTGEGSMLRIKTYSTPEEAEAANSEEYDRMRREIEQLKETIERQNRVIDALTGATSKENSRTAG